MRTTTRTLLALAATTTLVVAGLGSPALAGKGKGKGGGSAPTTGAATVFMVNPVQSLGDQTLTDSKDAASAVPDEAYDRDAPLRHLDGSGYLRGAYALVESSTGKAAYSASSEFHYDRSEDQFEQVMAYFWVTQAQDYLQSLGFTGENAILDEPVVVKVGQYGGDNSYVTEKPFRIRLGKGGVDDGEDGEVIVHEYGHAVHADQVPGFGSSPDAGAIGEGFGDYLAVTVGLDAVGDYGWTMRGNTAGEDDPPGEQEPWEAAACVADWDATSYYGGTVASCLRRVDQDFTVDSGQEGVHGRGMIWSGALWDIRKDYVAAGLRTTDWDRTLIGAQFDFAPDTSFADAAEITVARALENDGPAAAELVRAEFVERDILS